MLKNLILLGILFVTIGAALFFWKEGTFTLESSKPTDEKVSAPVPTPLAKYSFSALKARAYEGSEIELERVLKKEETYTSRIFSFTTDGKKVTGQLNLPNKSGKLPVIIMIRGYVDKEDYFTGLGTRKAAGYFAENGFITIAPDFLGFGGSDWESSDILEARFEKPITVLNLLESVKSLPQADTDNLFIWAHSNGGQITLSVLEISGKNIPTTLWAPVTRPFPESVTDYIYDMDDQGQMVKATISAFVKAYNSKDFSIASYFQDVNSPLQVHQGTRDILIETSWTDEFVEKMREFDRDVKYYVYKNDDHNLSLNWDEVAKRDLEFFQKHLQ